MDRTMMEYTVAKSVTWSFRQATVGVITQKSEVMEHVVCSRELYTIWKKLQVYYGSDGESGHKASTEHVTGAVPHELVLSDTQ
uniref:Uncharacterized protein n=1 Tax=Rangifer tarandus platyrhynchus TaxID=3082113 RepID=A0ACB0FNR1_RANTA|nr:unnamed protein product [Rangifer tarandus platyrhynchus]